MEDDGERQGLTGMWLRKPARLCRLAYCDAKALATMRISSPRGCECAPVQFSVQRLQGLGARRVARESRGATLATRRTRATAMPARLSEYGASW
jgi:hypothetical protein